MEVGAVFSRASWPAHVTLVSNFVTSEPVDAIGRALRRGGVPSAPVTIEFDGTDFFGPDRDIPVRLVRPGPLVEIHLGLIGELETLSDVREDEPRYWREGYRPHLTLTPSVDAVDGERRILRDIAIARLGDSLATVVASLTQVSS